ncbi:MAG TPA: STAS domain-containing protein [Solirubrobacteraceae bacterium]|jgi:anti-sigma B factor antagonist|nr:STAS domain-containing protein [Solirubrobacteraceae bacterium]
MAIGMTMPESAQVSGDTHFGPSPFMVLSREHDAQTTIVTVEGELDLSSAPRLKWMMMDAFEAGRSQLVVDLSRASFMDSTGLGVLIGVNKRLQPGTQLAIVCPPGAVAQVFEFSGTDGAFSLFPTLQAAIAHLEGRAPEAG